MFGASIFVGVLLAGCLGIFSPVIMKYDIQMVSGDYHEILPVVSSDSVKFAFACSVLVSIPAVIHVTKYSIVNGKPASNELNILWICLTAMKLPHILATALIWISSEYFIIIEALISVRTMITFASGLALLNTHGHETWRWVFVTPFVSLIYASLIIMNMAPFYSRSLLKSLYIVRIVLTGTALLILFALCVHWCIYIKSRISNNNISEYDRVCSINLVAFIILLIGMVITIEAQGQSEWTSFSPSYYIASTTMYCIYEFFLLIFSKERFLTDIQANNARDEGIMKQMVVGYFSHELRNPLNSAMIGLEVLRHKYVDDVDEPDEEFVELLKDVESSCLLTTDVLEDLVMYERLEAGELTLSQSTLAIIPLLQEKFGKFFSLARKRGIRFCVDFTDDCVDTIKIFMDESKLKHAIRSVLYYALECAGESGTVRAKVDVVLVESNGAVLCITVSNSGSSLSQEDRTTMFHEDKITFTAGVINSGKVGGLSLLIAHRIAALHGGYLGFSSDEHNAIVIRLPILGGSGKLSVGSGKFLGGSGKSRKFLGSVKVHLESSNKPAEMPSAQTERPSTELPPPAPDNIEGLPEPCRSSSRSASHFAVVSPFDPAEIYASRSADESRDDSLKPVLGRDGRGSIYAAGRGSTYKAQSGRNKIAFDESEDANHTTKRPLFTGCGSCKWSRGCEPDAHRVRRGVCV